MVLKVDRVVECVEQVQTGGDDRKASGANEPGRLVMLTPQGRKLNQRIVEDLAAEKRLLLLCGRYEGFDERIRDLLKPDEISIGDYILNGGETAAMVLIDACIRLLPGVLGDENSSRCDSFSGDAPWLEFPQYTRPREFRGLSVPDVLLSGDHEAVARWRREESRKRTLDRRPDLLDGLPDELGIVSKRNKRRSSDESNSDQ